MKIHYYLGWFNNFFPENLGRVLQEDITDRKSLAMISSNPSIYEEDGAIERSWLDQAGITFDEYHLPCTEGRCPNINSKCFRYFLVG